ncbi:hypothetical protein GDO81_025349 [Engystomops pustulosus]|uniref:Uncharacterized protein n=1 Tax=Engystomops pustulosus TaxID=76066 RepID=A0AAV6YID5_ENGPU|nr:hypothetical protein GDO81_025349 [Engystomops pustulosus]
MGRIGAVSGHRDICYQSLSAGSSQHHGGDVVRQGGGVRHGQVGGVSLQGAVGGAMPGALLVGAEAGQLGVGALADLALVGALPGVQPDVVT